MADLIIRVDHRTIEEAINEGDNPVHLALERSLGQTVVEDSSDDKRVLFLDGISLRLPSKARCILARWRRGGPMHPFEFGLDLPE